MFTQDTYDQTIIATNRPPGSEPQGRTPRSGSERPSSGASSSAGSRRRRPRPLSLPQRTYESPLATAVVAAAADWSPLKFIDSPSTRSVFSASPPQRSDRSAATGQDKQLIWKQTSPPPPLKLDPPRGVVPGPPPSQLKQLESVTLSTQRPGRSSAQVTQLTRQLSRKFSAKINNSFEIMEDAAFPFPFRNKTVSAAVVLNTIPCLCCHGCSIAPYPPPPLCLSVRARALGQKVTIIPAQLHLFKSLCTNLLNGSCTYT